MWRILDLLFPLCPWAWLARSRARASLGSHEQVESTTVEHFRGGWVVTFTQGESVRHRVVLRGSGVVYAAVGGYPGRRGTQRYFQKHRAMLPGNLWGGRRVWCLQIPCSHDERKTIAHTLGVLFERNDTTYPDWTERRWGALPGPLFYGSRAAMEWLSERLKEQGMPSRVRCVLRGQAPNAKLFRITHFAMSLPEALRDNGNTWQGNTELNRFEEARG